MTSMSMRTLKESTGSSRYRGMEEIVDCSQEIRITKKLHRACRLMREDEMEYLVDWKALLAYLAWLIHCAALNNAIGLVLLGQSISNIAI